MNNQSDRPWWRDPFKIVLAGFIAIAGFFLVTEHQAHAFGLLPLLLLLACPVMHLFMHHGHGGHEGSDRQPGEKTGAPHSH